jgi:hypothetical protein
MILHLQLFQPIAYTINYRLERVDITRASARMHVVEPRGGSVAPLLQQTLELAVFRRRPTDSTRSFAAAAGRSTNASRGRRTMADRSAAASVGAAAAAMVPSGEEGRGEGRAASRQQTLNVRTPNSYVHLYDSLHT